MEPHNRLKVIPLWMDGKGRVFREAEMSPSGRDGNGRLGRGLRATRLALFSGREDGATQSSSDLGLKRPLYLVSLGPLLSPIRAG